MIGMLLLLLFLSPVSTPQRRSQGTPVDKLVQELSEFASQITAFNVWANELDEAPRGDKLIGDNPTFKEWALYAEGSRGEVFGYKLPGTPTAKGFTMIRLSLQKNIRNIELSYQKLDEYNYRRLLTVGGKTASGQFVCIQYVWKNLK